MSAPFVTVEGPIGIGKTSLAQAISRAFGLPLLEEIVYENPFLGPFYENIEEWSFQLEMFFLCNRYKQLQDIADHYLRKGIPVVSDYNIFKNTIFARRTLRPDILAKYEQIYHILTDDLPQATLVVYLKGSLDTLLKRVAMRGRDVERNMDPSYLENLIHDYEAFMEAFQCKHPEVPVLTFSCDDLDYVHRQEDLEYVLKQIAPYIPNSEKHERQGVTMDDVGV